MAEKLPRIIDRNDRDNSHKDARERLNRDFFNNPNDFLNNQFQNADQIRSLLDSPFQLNTKVEVVGGTVVGSSRELLEVGEAGEIRTLAINNVSIDGFGKAVGSEQILGKCTQCGMLISGRENLLRCSRCGKVVCTNPECNKVRKNAVLCATCSKQTFFLGIPAMISRMLNPDAIGG